MLGGKYLENGYWHRVDRVFLFIGRKSFRRDCDIPGGSVTILVVDHDPTILETVSQMLKTKGHRPLVAASGQEALRICEKSLRRIDVMITDINMPQMTGVELAQCLARTHPHIAVIFMTRDSMETPQMRVLVRDGHFRSQDVLRKPFSSKMLDRAIKDVIQRKKRPYRPNSAIEAGRARHFNG